jgi:hypothetical protein
MRDFLLLLILSVLASHSIAATPNALTTEPGAALTNTLVSTTKVIKADPKAGDWIVDEVPNEKMLVMLPENQFATVRLLSVQETPGARVKYYLSINNPFSDIGLDSAGTVFYFGEGLPDYELRSADLNLSSHTKPYFLNVKFRIKRIVKEELGERIYDQEYEVSILFDRPFRKFSSLASVRKL